MFIPNLPFPNNFCPLTAVFNSVSKAVSKSTAFVACNFVRPAASVNSSKTALGVAPAEVKYVPGSPPNILFAPLPSQAKLSLIALVRPPTPNAYPFMSTPGIFNLEAPFTAKPTTGKAASTAKPRPTASVPNLNLFKSLL